VDHVVLRTNRISMCIALAHIVVIQSTSS
jgi:hypothetical protein